MNGIDDLEPRSVSQDEQYGELFNSEMMMVNSQEIEMLMKNFGSTDNDMKHEMDQQQQQQQQLTHYQPTPELLNIRHLASIPNLEAINSPFEFDVCVPPDQNNNVVFSQSKLFIKMNSKMMIHVSYREQSRNEQLFLRAMIICSKPEEMHLPVMRCANHRAGNITTDQQAMLYNILKINDPKAAYFGSEKGETFQDRLSVVLPIVGNYNEDNQIQQNIGLEFGCQNSCTSGINRRPTSLVFTLEDVNCQLLGKSAIEFKVCSCPKRDSERENSQTKRKHESNTPFPRGKRPKYVQPQQIKPEPESEDETSEQSQQPNDNMVSNFSLTSVQIQLPSELARDLVKYAHDLVAGRMADDNKRSAHLEFYEKCLKDIKKLRKRFENPAKQ